MPLVARTGETTVLRIRRQLTFTVDDYLFLALNLVKARDLTSASYHKRPKLLV